MTQKAVNNAKVLYRLNVLRSDVEQAHKIFKKAPFLLETLTNPVVSEEAKEAVLDKIVRQSGLPNLLGNFMKMMCRIGEIGQITDIFNCYYKYWDERNHILHAEVIYADEETKKEIQDMINEGITSFKLYMTYPAMIVDDEDLYKIIKALNEKGCFAGVHCENAGVIDALTQEAKAQGKLGPENHPLVRPDTMEAEAVHRLLVIAKEAGAPVMVVHLTNRKAYEEIIRARENGQSVFAETCPQYLLLDDSVYSKPDFEGAKYVCAPPIRKKADQDCLWKALADGDIQTVATDQCSFTLAQKAMGKADFTKIPGGLPGVQTRGTLLYTYGVRTGKITVEKMCQLLCENPAKLYGVYPNKGVIAEGSDADIVVFDPEKENVISAETHAYNTDNNPYEGFEIHGDIDKVFLRGKLAVDDGKLVQEKLGTYIKRGLRQPLA